MSFRLISCCFIRQFQVLCSVLHLQVEDPQDWAGEGGTEGRGHYYIPPVIPPLFDRPLAAPTPASTRCNTPVWDLDGEKRVRFLEPEVCVMFVSSVLSVRGTSVTEDE